jgi:hypothetical protein
MSVCTARAPRRLESISNGRFQHRKADNRDRQPRVNSSGSIELAAPGPTAEVQRRELSAPKPPF